VEAGQCQTTGVQQGSARPQVFSRAVPDHRCSAGQCQTTGVQQGSARPQVFSRCADAALSLSHSDKAAGVSMCVLVQSWMISVHMGWAHMGGVGWGGGSGKKTRNLCLLCCKTECSCCDIACCHAATGHTDWLQLLLATAPKRGDGHWSCHFFCCCHFSCCMQLLNKQPSLWPLVAAGQPWLTL
jgi:hypothetical protein